MNGSGPSPGASDTGNLLLDALPGEHRDRLMPHLRPTDLVRGRVLYEQDQPIGYVVFPIDGVVSLVVPMEDGSMVETATVGREGMVGLGLFLVERPEATHRAVVQVSGRGYAMDADAFRSHGAGSAIRQVLLGYTSALLAQIARSVACNGVHALRQRCARWLLQTSDRVGSNGFLLTQEFLAVMLGVRRASVTQVAGELRDAGILRYRRGWIEILDRPALERASCECYGAVREHYAWLIPGLAPGPMPSGSVNVPTTQR